MEYEKIISEIGEVEVKENAEKFAAYCIKLSRDPKTDFILKKSEKALADMYRRVASEGLVFDGVHITLQSTGVSYDYVAFKNKMYIVYPETQFDASLVYPDDVFSFKKENGKVVYSHTVGSPFGQKDSEIIGAYAVVRNKRGEYITLLSADDIAKHRKVAKTDFIWKAWFSEMCLKTIVKKACKLHFGDIFTGVEEMDNENYDLKKVSAETIRNNMDRPDSSIT